MDEMPQGEPNYFELGLINYIPAERQKFDWLGFQPSSVKTADDLPQYLIFGALNKKTLQINETGWYAEWTDEQQKAKVTMGWRSDTHKYTLTQVWQDAEGSSAVCDDTEPLSNVISKLYADGFPKAWDEKGKMLFESFYQMAWLPWAEGVPLYVGLPDGIFRVISFPVMVKNIRNARDIINRIATDNKLPYAFRVTATISRQHVAFKIGTAPDWTSDAGAVVTQMIGETGFIPLEMPKTETINGDDYMTITRMAMMVNVAVPFGKLFDMLKYLSETPMQIEVVDGERIVRRDITPVIKPEALSEKFENYLVEDPDQGVRVITELPDDEKTFDELMQQDNETLLGTLEQFSDMMIEQLVSEVESERSRQQ